MNAVSDDDFSGPPEFLESEVMRRTAPKNAGSTSGKSSILRKTLMLGGGIGLAGALSVGLVLGFEALIQKDLMKAEFLSGGSNSAASGQSQTVQTDRNGSLPSFLSRSQPNEAATSPQTPPPAPAREQAKTDALSAARIAMAEADKLLRPNGFQRVQPERQPTAGIPPQANTVAAQTNSADPNAAADAGTGVLDSPISNLPLFSSSSSSGKSGQTQIAAVPPPPSFIRKSENQSARDGDAAAAQAYPNPTPVASASENSEASRTQTATRLASESDAAKNAAAPVPPKSPQRKALAAAEAHNKRLAEERNKRTAGTQNRLAPLPALAAPAPSAAKREPVQTAALPDATAETASAAAATRSTPTEKPKPAAVSEPAQPKSAPAQKSKNSGDGFAVQIASYVDAKNAKAMSNRLSAAGFTPEIATKRTGGRDWSVVRVRSASRSAAEADAQKIAAQFKVSPMVARIEGSETVSLSAVKAARPSAPQRATSPQPLTQRAAAKPASPAPAPASAPTAPAVAQPLTAQQRAEAAGEKDPLQLGRAAMQDGAYMTALAFFEQTLKADPRNLPALMNTGVAYRKLGQPQKALKAFEAALDVDPANRDALIEGTGVIAETSAIDALAFLRSREERSPNSDLIAAQMAAILANVGDLPAAIQKQQQAISRAPSNPAHVLDLAALYERAGRTKEARQLYQTVVASPAARQRLSPSVIQAVQTRLSTMTEG
ncbi:MAG: tetratricopeptide repeat protein [Pseudomonadota bacterium]